MSNYQIQAFLTEGTYTFEGRDLPELEILIQDNVMGPSKLSILFDANDNTVCINVNNRPQGSSSTNVPNDVMESFLVKALTQLQKGKL